MLRTMGRPALFSLVEPRPLPVFSLFSLFLAALASLVLWVSPALAQQSTGAVGGRVVDASGAPIAGADVVLRRNGVLVAHANADSAGTFRFNVVPVGDYSVEAEQIGYRRERRGGVRVLAGRPTVIELTLQLAPVGVKGLEVVGSSPVHIRKQDTELGTSLPQQAIQMLPTPTSAAQLVQNTPGARPNHVWGAATAQANNYEIDGLAANDPGVGGQLLTPSIQWVDHIDVLGLGSPAEYGDFQGGVVAVTTKSGSNRLQGQVRMTMENEALNASNITTGEIGSQTQLHRDLEAEVRGPIWKDHLFYYVSGELVQRNLHPENHLPEFTGRFSPYSNDSTTRRLFGKLTVTPTKEDRIDISGGRIETDASHAGGIGYETPGATLNGTAPSSFGSVAWTRAFGSHVALDLRGATFQRDDRRDPYNGVNTPGAMAFAFTPPYSLYVNAPMRDRIRATNNDVKASLTVSVKTLGVGNRFKVGGELNRGTYLQQRFRDGGVTWRPVITQNFDPANPSTWTFDAGGRPFLASTWGGDVNLDAAVENDGLYAQDDITLGSHLSLSPGVRWGRWVGWLRPAGGGPRFRAASDQALEPRLGVVLDVTGKGDFVIKGHWGRYHQSMFAQFFDRAQGGDVYSNTSLYYYWDPDLSRVDQPWTTALRDSPPSGSFQKMEEVVVNQTGPVENYHQPYVDQWVVSVEKSVVDHWKFSAIYVNRRNRNMVALQDLNVAQDYGVFNLIRVSTGGDFFGGSGGAVMYNGYPLTLPRLYVPNWAINNTLKCATQEGSLCSVPPGYTFADIDKLPWDPKYVLTNAPGAVRKFDQVQLVVNADYPHWGAQASLVFTRLRGNLDNVSGYQQTTAYDDPTFYSPGPYVWPNEQVNWYGSLEHFADTEFKLSLWGDLPAGFQGGVYWNWATGDHYTPQFRLNALQYDYQTVFTHQVIDEQMIQAAAEQPLFVEPRGSWTYEGRGEFDVHLEHPFHVGEGAVSVMLDVYNLFNFGTVTLMNTDVNKGQNYYGFLGQVPDPQAYYQAIRQRVQPRTIRIGTVVRF